MGGVRNTDPARILPGRYAFRFLRFLRDCTSQSRVRRPRRPGRANEPIRRFVPSMTTICALFFGACIGGLGIYLSQTESRKYHQAWIASAGLIVCSIAFVLVLSLMARAAQW